LEEAQTARYGDRSDATCMPPITVKSGQLREGTLHALSLVSPQLTTQRAHFSFWACTTRAASKRKIEQANWGLESSLKQRCSCLRMRSISSHSASCLSLLPRQTWCFTRCTLSTRYMPQHNAPCQDLESREPMGSFRPRLPGRSHRPPIGARPWFALI
jgi:hypothetical protein